MLTRQQVIDAFVLGIDKIPADELIEIYEQFTQEQLDAVIARNIAIRNDPTFVQRTADDYEKFMAATPEEQAVWQQIEPNTVP